MKEIHTVVIALSMIVLMAVIYSVNVQAQISRETIDNSGRREYTYCPISDNDAKSINAEINGCPLMRIYINAWNDLTPLEQSAIDSKLRSLGFVDSGEHIIK